MQGLTMQTDNIFPIEADEHGLPLQRIAHKIMLLDATAVVPHDRHAAQALLDKLERKVPSVQPSRAGLRGGQYHDMYNENLSLMARARRLGVRPADAKLPPPPEGLISEDHLQVLQEVVQQLGEDVDRHESMTEEQRRIMRLEARVKALVDHNNSLVTALKDQEARIARLEAVIAGPHAA
jgi:hypothetical protein